MGIYINKGNQKFQDVTNGLYVDKTGLITEINMTLFTENRYTCVTRCRRFGKSMAADMLCAYYDKSCDSRQLFDGLEISVDESYEKHLNRYPVLYLDITDFTTRYRNNADIIDLIQKEIQKEVLSLYPNIANDNSDLMETLVKISNLYEERFIFIIDEWDAILREYKDEDIVKNAFIDLLRRLFKGSDSNKVFAGVYMTGILPIKKYKTESALNNFIEYSVISPKRLDKFFGFTPEEVKTLSSEHNLDYSEFEKWYDGYTIGSQHSMFNPSSVMKALWNKKCESYWGATGAFENVSDFIQRNFDGLKDDVLTMLSGERIDVDTSKFQNDMYVINCKDDVLTVLIHLGYLAYNENEQQCYIPNREVGIEMKNAVEATSWKNIAKALESSRKLLRDTLAKNEAAVAAALERVHDEETSILSYNSEESLSCAISIAYYYARNEYIIHRELATGKGFADLVFIPRKNVDKPAMVIELKYNKDADAAIDQIKRKEYPAKVQEYLDTCPLQDSCGESLLLVGINYDKDTKTHSCIIEKYTKE